MKKLTETQRNMMLQHIHNELGALWYMARSDKTIYPLCHPIVLAKLESMMTTTSDLLKAKS